MKKVGYLLVMAMLMAGVSCSDPWTHQGTIKRHGIFYKKAGEGDPATPGGIKKSVVIELEEYPGKIFEMDLSKAKRYSGYQQLEELGRQHMDLTGLLDTKPKQTQEMPRKKIFFKCLEKQGVFEVIDFKED